MTSKTRLHSLVTSLRWKEAEAGIRENPALLAFRDREGRNWLHVCCGVDLGKQGGTAAASIRTAEVLLDAGIDINEPAFSEGKWKATPLWYAIARAGNLALARYLIERGSDPNHSIWAAVNRDSPAALRLLIEGGATDPTDEESSPLLAAVQWKKFAAARQLLKLGADVNFQDPSGTTPLHHLLKKRSDVKHVRMLLRYSARLDLRDADGLTALDLMMRRKDPQFRRMAAQAARRNRSVH